MNPASLSCFDFLHSDNRPLKLEEARRLLLAMADQPTPIESVALSDLSGRVLAEPVVAPFDVPRQTNSAMDGYAICGHHIAPHTRFRVIGESLAGHGFEGRIELDQAVRITTGAPIPEGADTVVMREQCREVEGYLHVEAAERVRVGDHVRIAGEDLADGSRVLEPGQRLGSVEVGLLASLGIARARVHAPLQVALFSTGDEVCAPGAAVSEAGIYDTNRFTLAAMLCALGCEVIDLGILPDHPESLKQALTDARSRARLVITSGGVSVGAADYVKQALAELGQTTFWQLALRPGRPMAFGELGVTEGGEPCLFAGLPGNPVAAMVTFMLVLQPMIRRLMGETEWVGITWPAIAAETLRGRRGRSDFHRGIFTVNERCEIEVRTTGAQGSGILTSMYQANCLIRIGDEQADVEQGGRVRIYPFSRWLPGFPLV